jgi:AbrB family looped-hinge helix DNA binding protein
MFAETVTIDRTGRIALPQRALDALGLEPNDEVVIEISEAGLVIKPKQVDTSIADDWSHEGLDDPDGDELLAQDAVAILEDIQAGRVALIPWEQVEAELDHAEAAGELHS